jgi:hypothetical protein
MLEPAADQIGAVFVLNVADVFQMCPDGDVELDLAAIDNIAFFTPNCVFMATLPYQNRVILTSAYISSLFNILILSNFNRTNKWHAYCYRL